MNYKQKMIMEFEKKINKELNKLVEIKDEEEKRYKLEVLYNLHKFLMNYDELEPVLVKFFENKKRKNRFKREER